ncbi:MAG TPA: alpha/beta hydrolase [Alphaproteobacteria bacterium]|nr:alpha/beta hydrolase [Alphaproteobacteria bacterium]
MPSPIWTPRNERACALSVNGTAILIHGAFCGGWAMEPFARYFEAAGYRTLCPTLRHHNVAPNVRAPQALGTTSVLDYVEDLLVLVRALPEAPVLIGHSMGGLIAQMIAARTPVRALVLIAPSAPWGTLPTTPWEVAAAQGLFLAGQFWNRPLKPKQWIAVTHALDLLPNAEREAVFARFVPESGLATFEIMHWPLDLRRASFVEPGAVKCPVLCLAGAQDRVNPPKTVASVAKRYRDQGAYEEFRGMSHWLIGEPGWERLAAHAEGWLKQVA